MSDPYKSVNARGNQNARDKTQRSMCTKAAQESAELRERECTIVETPVLRKLTWQTVTTARHDKFLPWFGEILNLKSKLHLQVLSIECSKKANMGRISGESILVMRSVLCLVCNQRRGWSSNDNDYNGTVCALARNLCLVLSGTKPSTCGMAFGNDDETCYF